MAVPADGRGRRKSAPRKRKSRGGSGTAGSGKAAKAKASSGAIIRHATQLVRMCLLHAISLQQ